MIARRSMTSVLAAGEGGDGVDAPSRLVREAEGVFLVGGA
jgi:hypothetical protein